MSLVFGDSELNIQQRDDRKPTNFNDYRNNASHNHKKVVVTQQLKFTLKWIKWIKASWKKLGCHQQTERKTLRCDLTKDK